MAGFLDKIKGAAKGAIQGLKDMGLSNLIPGWDVIKGALNGLKDEAVKTANEIKDDLARKASEKSSPPPPPSRPAPAQQQQRPQPHPAWGQPDSYPPLPSQPATPKAHTDKGTPLYSTNPATHIEVKKGKEVEISCPVMTPNGPQIAKVKVPQEVFDKGGGVQVSNDGKSVQVFESREAMLAGQSKTVNVPPGHFQSGGTVDVGKNGQPVAKGGNQERMAEQMRGFKGATQGQGAQEDDKGPSQAPSQTPQNPAHASQKQPAGAAR